MSGNSNRLFLSSPPNLSLLEAFEGEALDCCTLPAVKAKCRELVRGDPMLLAGPTNQQFFPPPAGFTIWIVAKKGYLTEDARIKQRLTNAKIKLIGRVPVSLDLVLVCYRSTLTARLAPKWNVISDWIVRGNEIFETGRGQALKLNIGMNAKEITLSLSSYKLVINFLKPEDLDVSTSLLNRFKRDPDCVINETAISSNCCYILPNFTRAHVFTATHSTPQSSEFESYDRIRLHWKKQYGFILPESQSLFYQVFFKFNPGKFFSYPGCCVATNRPIVCPSREIHQLTANFVNDIHTRMPSLCGQQIKFSNKPLTLLTTLQTVPCIGDQPNTRPAPVARYSTSRSEKPVLGRPNLPPLQEPPQLVPERRMPTGSHGTKPCYPAYHSTASNRSNLGPPTNEFQLQQGSSKVPSSSLLQPCSGTTAQPRSGTTAQPHSGTTAQPHSGAIVPVFKSATERICTQTSSSPSLTTGNQKRPIPLSLKKSQPPSKRVCNNENNTDTPNIVSGVREPVQVVPALEDELSNTAIINTSFEASTMVSNKKKKQTLEPSCASMAGSLDKDLMKTLQKTKVPSLKVWLKKNGVVYTSKAKKDELVRLAVQHLNVTGKQFELPSL